LGEDKYRIEIPLHPVSKRVQALATIQGLQRRSQGLVEYPDEQRGEFATGKSERTNQGRCFSSRDRHDCKSDRFLKIPLFVAQLVGRVLIAAINSE